GDQVLEVNHMSYTLDNGTKLFHDLTFFVNKGDKIAFLSKESLAVTSLFQILAGELNATKGEFKYGQTITKAFLPLNNESYFKSDDNLVDWLRQYALTDEEKEEANIR